MNGRIQNCTPFFSLRFYVVYQGWRRVFPNKDASFCEQGSPLKLSCLVTDDDESDRDERKRKKLTENRMPGFIFYQNKTIKPSFPLLYFNSKKSYLVPFF